MDVKEWVTFAQRGQGRKTFNYSNDPILRHKLHLHGEHGPCEFSLKPMEIDTFVIPPWNNKIATAAEIAGVCFDAFVRCIEAYKTTQPSLSILYIHYK